MPTITVNASDLEVRRARESLLTGFQALDGKRPTAWAQYGYPQQVSFAQLLSAYSRGGAGHGAVHKLLDKCWQHKPRIKKPDSDDASPWEQKLDDLMRGIKGWQKLRDFDRRNMVGRFAALIYRVADSQTLDKPMTRASKLVDIVPLYENQIKVTQWFTDQADTENFGKPRMFQYRSAPERWQDTQARPEQWVDVHPSRVQILAEGSVGDMFDGVPLLLAGFNSLVDLEKVSGGSAESFLKNSARTIVFKFDKDSNPQAITQNTDGSSTGKSVAEVIEEKSEALNKNIDASIALAGGEASTLQTQQSDPTKPFEVAANLFAASVQIPFTILFGQQTGRLASDEDKADFIARAVSRQANELTPMLEEFVRRMQAAGIVEQGEFEIEWPPLDAPGDDAKFAQLGKLTAAMQQAHGVGLAPIFTMDELRQVAGFEPMPEDQMLPEGDPLADDPSADPTADPAQQQGGRQPPRVVSAR